MSGSLRKPDDKDWHFLKKKPITLNLLVAFSKEGMVMQNVFWILTQINPLGQ